MTLHEQMRESGQWLFRYRSYLPIVLLPAVAAAIILSAHPAPRGAERGWEAFCFTLSLLGLAVRAYTVGTTPAGTSGRNTRNQAADVLNTTGAYSVLRNPLYLGNALMWAGLVVYPRSLWLALLAAFAFWAMYERIIFAEEEFLRARFGDTYLAWAAVTPAFFPRVWAFRPAALPFSLRNVLKREYSGMLALVLLFSAEVLLWRRFANGRWKADGPWLAILAAACVLYLLLRTLRRQTRLLHVEGR
jgi:protein-S-isoprenylcysteine O-methyltransferase Ste14